MKLIENCKARTEHIDETNWKLLHKNPQINDSAVN